MVGCMVMWVVVVIVAGEGCDGDSVVVWESDESIWGDRVCDCRCGSGCGCECESETESEGDGGCGWSVAFAVSSSFSSMRMLNSLKSPWINPCAANLKTCSIS